MKTPAPELHLERDPRALFFHTNIKPESTEAKLSVTVKNTAVKTNM